jgi:TetR/AcrR family transcriptional regulator, transcriptional repressor for nem operon
MRSSVMRITQAASEENRRRVIEAAMMLFREKGFNGVGLIEIMNSAGLTAGGFYAKFDSKSGLQKEATLKALDETMAWWTSIVDAAPAQPIAALLDDYLLRPHKTPEKLCVFATLGADVARQDRRFRAAFADRLRPMIALLASIMPARTEAGRHRNAVATLSMMIGAMTLIRAIHDDDLSREIAAAVRDAAQSLS